MYRIENGGKVIFMKTKKIIALFLSLFIFMSLPITACAYELSAKGTYSLRETKWYYETTAGKKLQKTKATDGTICHVKTNSLTMYNNPVFRLVNSDNVKRSDSIKMGEAGEVESGDCTATKNYYYYASVKPSIWQTGTDTVTLQFSPD